MLLGLGALVVYGTPELRTRAVGAWETLVARVSAPRERERSKAKSTIRVVSEPAGALVERGHERLGTTPFVLTARVGSSHRLAFSMPGYAPVTREVTVEPEASTTIVILKPARADAK